MGKVDHLSTAESIFFATLGRDSAGERAAYLDQACGQDQELRRHVERLLGAYAASADRATIGAADVLGTPDMPPAAGLGATLGPPPVDRVRERPGTAVGPYKLMEQIGEGGFGLVFVAEQQHPVRRKVAVKVIKPGMDSRDVVARFEAERQALALMDHPNIARVLDAGTTAAGQPYFVMELVKGIPITDYCDQCRLTPRRRLELFLAVCNAVQHAHQKGVIHRDLKPNNVLVTLHDGAPVVKVIDFGVAKALGQQLTDKTLYTGYAQMIGTPLYMSPEQAQMSGLDIDTRSDIYSLGVLLYELLTGTTPFDRKRFGKAAFDEIRRIIRDEDPPRPSTRLTTMGETLSAVSASRGTEPKKLSALVKGDLDWIVMKAMEKDRTRRYATANGLAMDVRRFLDEQPVEARPPSTWYRFEKLARRNRAALTMVAAVALALLLGTAASVWQAVRADAQRDRALAAERTAKAEKDNAQAALDFLWQDVLSQASPFNEPDRDLKVRDLLDRVAERLQQTAAAPASDPPAPGRGPPAPPVDAAVRRMLGELYADLGDSAKAERLLKQAMDVQAKELGEENRQTLATMHALGFSQLRGQNPAAAEPLLARTLDLRRRTLGDEHPDTLATMGLLAVCYNSLGRGAEAEAMLRQALEAQSRRLGDTHRDAVFTRYLLSVVLAQGRGTQDEVEALQRRCVEQFRRVLGADHPWTLAATNSLAATYLNHDEPDRAERLASEVRQAARTRLGPQHPFTLQAMLNLATAYQLQGRDAEARPLIDVLVAEPQTDPETGRPRRHVPFGLRLLGRDQVRGGQHLAAERTLRECQRLLEQLPPNTAKMNRPAVQVLLGASLLGQKKYAEAETELLQGCAAMNHPGPHPIPLVRRQQVEALGWLVQLYEEWGKPDEAAKWRKELDAARPAQGRRGD